MLYPTLTTKRASRGFTLIELLVVMAIVTIISSITLVSYSKFGGQILLRNLVYDVALTVRQAQVHGISGSGFNAKNFSAGNGIAIDLNNSRTQFSLYTDVNKNGLYSTPSIELMNTYTIRKGYSISKICVPINGVDSCTVSKLDILFTRPEPDAAIRIYTSTGWKPVNSVRITFLSPQGNTMSVVIETTGQISIQK